MAIFEDFGKFGEGFQKKILKLIVEDDKFFRRVKGVFDPNVFTDSVMRDFAAIVSEYYKKYECLPWYDTIKVIYDTERTYATDIDKEMFREFSDEICGMGVRDIDFTEDYGYKMLKSRKTVKLARLLAQACDSENESKVDEYLSQLNSINNDEDCEYTVTGVYDNVEDVLKEDYRISVPVGIAKIDEILEGGLAKCELGLIVGPTSFGKTSLTTEICINASRTRSDVNGNEGFKVLQVIFEDNPKNIQRKHIANITETESRLLSRSYKRKEVMDRLMNEPDRELIEKNLKIVSYMSGTCGVRELRRMLKKMRNEEGFIPDLMTLDYFSCMKPSGDPKETKWDRQSMTMRELENLSKEFNIAIWVTHQGNKESLSAKSDEDENGMTKSGGSIGILQIAHIVMVITKTREESRANRATIEIPKSRSGKAQVKFRNVYFNNGTCRMNSDEAYEDTGAIIDEPAVTEAKPEIVDFGAGVSGSAEVIESGNGYKIPSLAFGNKNF